MFQDKRHAGKLLAGELEHYKGKEVLVLGIQRGGAETGIEVAKHLGVEFSILVFKKLSYPEDPEVAFGAMAEDGSTFLFPSAKTSLSVEQIDEIKEGLMEEIERRVDELRGPLPQIEGRTVILVDDGLATATMYTAIEMCRARGAQKVVVAVPVADRGVADEIETIADEFIVLEIPPYFQAVGQVYQDFTQTSDAQVREIMAQA